MKWLLIPTCSAITLLTDTRNEAQAERLEDCHDAYLRKLSNDMRIFRNTWVKPKVDDVCNDLTALIILQDPDGALNAFLGVKRLLSAYNQEIIARRNRVDGTLNTA